MLVYKPFRKIGKSEKLLHRRLEPYKILRRTSDLNYEVERLRNKTEKTEVVHGTNLKKCYLPTDDWLNPHTKQKAKAWQT